MGATESNAGDDYHFWWAAERAFELLRPGTDLVTVSIEGANADLDEDTDQIVDVGEYFGGADPTSAATIVLTQLKYSTRNPAKTWTLARLTPTSARTSGAAANATAKAPGSNKSIIGAMAKAYVAIRSESRPEARIALRLVSNQPADARLLDALAAAQSFTSSDGAWDPSLSTDLEQLSAQQAEVVQALVTASTLSGDRARDFLMALDLSGCGGMDRSTLHDTVSRQVIDDIGEGASEAIGQLVDLVRAEAMPDARGWINKGRVLTRLGLGDADDLLPAPDRVDRVRDPVATDWSEQLARLVSSPENSRIWVHGAPGVGKTQTAVGLRDHLPQQSVVVIYDCFGAGTYLDTGLERYTDDAFVRQVCNSLALEVGSSLLLGVDQRDRLWRHLLRRLEAARTIMPDDAELVIVVDAADNARHAASRRGRGSFLDGLQDFKLPAGVTLVVSTQTARALPDLRTDAELEIDGYERPASRAFLRQTYPGATGSEAERFHVATSGNPRVQRYTLETAVAEAWSVQDAIDNGHLTPEAMFAMILNTANQGCASLAVAERLHCMLMTSQRPLRYDDMLATADTSTTPVTDQDVAAFLAGLAPGVRLGEGLVLFYDENFEHFLTDEAEKLATRDPSLLESAFTDWGSFYLRGCEQDLFSAECVAAALDEAEMLVELINLARISSAFVVKDAVRRRRVIRERYRLGIGAASRLQDTTAGLELAVRAASASGSDAAVDELLFRARALGARFGDAVYMKSHLLRLGGDVELTAYHCLMARVDAQERDLGSAAAHVVAARAGRAPCSNPESVSVHEMACLVEVVWTLDGISKALDLLESWVPNAERALVLTRTVRMYVASNGIEVLDELVASQHSCLEPLGARAAVAAGVAVIERHRLGAWVGAGVARAGRLSEEREDKNSGTDVSGFPPGFTPYQSFARGPRGVPRQSAADRRQTDSWAAEAALVQAVTDAVALPCGDGDTERLLWEDSASEDFMRIPTSDRTIEGLLPYVISRYGSIDADSVRRLMRLADEAYAVGEDLQRYLVVQDPDPDDRRTSRPSDGLVEDLGSLVALCDLRSAAIWGDDADAQRLHDHVTLTVESKEAAVRERRWYQPDERYRAWAGVAFDGLLRAGYEPEVGLMLSAAAAIVNRSAASDVSGDLSRIAFEHDLRFVDTAIALIRLASQQAAKAGLSAEKQADLRCVGALHIADLRPDVAATLYEEAIGIVMQAPEDELSALSMLASLTTAARMDLRDDERRTVADDLVRRVDELMGWDATALDWPSLFTTLGALNLPIALAAASRWEDGDIVSFDESLPHLLTAASDRAQVSPSVALALLECVPDARSQLDAGISALDVGGIEVADRRTYVRERGDWIRRHASSDQMPELESQLLQAAQKWGVAGRSTRRRTGIGARQSGVRSSASEGADQAGSITLVAGEEGRWEQLGLASDSSDGQRSAWWQNPAERQEMLRRRLAIVPADLRVAALEAVLDGLIQFNSFSYFIADVLTEVSQRWHGADVQEWLDEHVAEVALYALPALIDLRGSGAENLASLASNTSRSTGIQAGVLDFIAQVGIDADGSELSALVEMLIILSDAATCATVVRALAPPPQTEQAVDEISSTNEAIAQFLYSLFGHPRRAMRWRAAHAVRALAQASQAHEVIDRLCLLACEEVPFDARYRQEELFFFAMSAQMWSLMAIERVADEHTDLIRPHLARFVGLATSAVQPHAAVRELARRAALKVDPTADLLLANRPRACQVRRHHPHISDQRTRGSHRYDFDAIDTIPYWFGHLARVFGTDVEQVATVAEEFVVDRWSFERATWWNDKRELRDERSFGSGMHRQGIVPPVESVSRYIDYHAMLTAAGAMIDTGVPILFEEYSDADNDPWSRWLAEHLPGRADSWLADTADPRPALPDARYDLAIADLGIDAFADVLGIVDGVLPKEVLAYASRDFYLPGAPDGHVWVASALVTPQGVGALQRALESSTNPSDWKLPSEGETDFEFERYGYAMSGWLDERDREDLIGLDSFDPLATSLRWGTQLPGSRFRKVAGAELDPRGRTLSIKGFVVARASQWGDAHTSQTSTWVNSATLVDFLRAIGRDLIVDVQIALDDGDRNAPHRAKARIFHVDQSGRVNTAEPRRASST